MVSAAVTDDARGTSSPSVLVVDDDPGTVETTAALLRRAGMRVHAAVTGEDALATARH
jgi:CheY-like chemotaxis protein